MKKIAKISVVLLSLVMAAALCVCVFADDTRKKGEYEGDALYSLGLIKGMSDKVVDYGLDGTPTRIQALVMVVRYLGAEEEALAGTWNIPFTDVADWAKPYVGYAYENAITNGISATEYGSDAEIPMPQFLTFILRVLGYKDSGDTPDFKWDNPYELAQTLGIAGGKPADGYAFVRADVMEICYAALSAKFKGEDTVLSDKLIENKTISEQTLAAAAEIAKTGAGYQGRDVADVEITPAVPTVKTYKITFIIENERYIKQVEEGKKPTYNGTPEKPDSSNYYYVFTGWDKTVVPAVADAEYTAQFKSVKIGGGESAKYYTITWVVDGAQSTSRVKEGRVPVFSGTPAKASDELFSYTFDGWDTTPTAAEANATYTAEFLPVRIAYTVTWIVDGKETTSVVKTGEMPSYSGTPAKESDKPDEYEYEFDGWTPELAAASADATYTAKFKEAACEYTITFLNDDGSEISSAVYEYGQAVTVPENPSPLLDYGMEVDGETPRRMVFQWWVTEDDDKDKHGTYSNKIPAATEDVTYTAYFNDEGWSPWI